MGGFIKVSEKMIGERVRESLLTLMVTNMRDLGEMT